GRGLRAVRGCGLSTGEQPAAPDRLWDLRALQRADERRPIVPPLAQCRGRGSDRNELTLPMAEARGFSVHRSPPGRARTDTISLSVPPVRATFPCAPRYVDPHPGCLTASQGRLERMAWFSPPGFFGAVMFHGGTYSLQPAEHPVVKERFQFTR